MLWLLGLCKQRLRNCKYFCTGASEVIRAFPRENEGRSVCEKLRNQGLVPCTLVLEQHRRKRLFSVFRHEIYDVISRLGLPFFCSRTFKLHIFNNNRCEDIIESYTVLPFQVRRRSHRGEILKVLFVWAPNNVQLEVDVPLIFKGEDACLGLRKGGYLSISKRSVRYLCPTNCIPPYIAIDLSKLDIGDKVYAHNLNVDPTVKIIDREASLVCTMTGSKPFDFFQH